jgi:hypothetical protein
MNGKILKNGSTLPTAQEIIVHLPEDSERTSALCVKLEWNLSSLAALSPFDREHSWYLGSSHFRLVRTGPSGTDKRVLVIVTLRLLSLSSKVASIY